jgi:hypothetical protein
VAARYFSDLTPQFALTAAVVPVGTATSTPGLTTEDTPTVVETTCSKDGVVIAQVGQVVDKVPRGCPRRPGSFHCRDYIEAAPPFFARPLFTLAAPPITEMQVLTAMEAIKCLYGEANPFVPIRGGHEGPCPRPARHLSLRSNRAFCQLAGCAVVAVHIGKDRKNGKDHSA